MSCPWSRLAGRFLLAVTTKATDDAHENSPVIHGVGFMVVMESIHRTLKVRHRDRVPTVEQRRRHILLAHTVMCVAQAR